MKPTDIELAHARSIVTDMLMWKYVDMGLHDGPAPDLAKHSLRELLDANAMVRDHGTVTHPDGTQSIPMKCADRLIAALYAATHFMADRPDEAEPIVIGRGKALVCVAVPDRQNDAKQAQPSGNHP